jgi:hypothetical protein
MRIEAERDAANALARDAVHMLRDVLELRLMPAKRRKERERDVLDRCLLLFDRVAGRPPSLAAERVAALNGERDGN